MLDPAAPIIRENNNQKTETILQNVIANIEFKKFIPIENKQLLEITEIKNLVMLEASSTKQVYYAICDYMRSKGFIGFIIKDINIIQENETIDTNAIISIPNGQILEFSK